MYYPHPVVTSQWEIPVPSSTVSNAIVLSRDRNRASREGDTVRKRKRMEVTCLKLWEIKRKFGSRTKSVPALLLMRTPLSRCPPVPRRA